MLGVLDGAAPMVPATFVRRDGDAGTVTRSATVIGEGRPGPGDPVLVQVSRWGTGSRTWPGSCAASPTTFAPVGDGYLMLVGPAVKDVSDDPEGAAGR